VGLASMVLPESPMSPRSSFKSSISILVVCVAAHPALAGHVLVVDAGEAGATRRSNRR
jgi:hypothetical protein